jgi:hypothetical protein
VHFDFGGNQEESNRAEQLHNRAEHSRSFERNQVFQTVPSTMQVIENAPWKGKPLIPPLISRKVHPSRVANSALE